MKIHPVALLVILALFFAPLSKAEAGNLTAYGTGQWLMRTVPSLAGAVGGWFLGGPLGLFGKIVGAYVGLKIGLTVGNFLARTINPLLPGSYQHGYNYPPPYYPDQGYYPWSPQAPSSEGDGASKDVEAAKAEWEGAVGKLKEALDKGTADDQAKAHAALKQAEANLEKAMSGGK